MNRSIRKMTVFAVVAILTFVLYSTKQRHDIVKAFAAYGASGKPDAELIAGFSTCLKQQTFVLPLRSVECSSRLAAKYGHAATYRIDAVAKTLTF